ncbi:MAG: ABC transporter permease subunit [Planctomycetaceae bacterium]|nr:ABC transporter permease subunit [Planctomycetaceae bacterium]
MRPYLAIIKDSFREAFASRVLWVLLALITVVLVAVAPLTYVQKATVGLRAEDVESWPDLVAKMRESSRSERASPSKHIWSLLSAEERKALSEHKRLPEQPNFRDLREFQRWNETAHKAIAGVIEKPEFYDPASWKGVSAGQELKQLQKQGYEKLSDQERQRFRRLLFESAFADFVAVSPATSFQFRYFAWDMGFALPIRKQELVKTLNTNLPWLIDKCLLSIGLLVAILVTAPIVPQMLDPGSIHLLLSKPISRAMLYLSKFLGGCAFVLLCSTYFFVGLWLVMGVRLGIWEPRLLWCILIYTFVFAVYFSVAALAGAIWRNTIVAVMVAIVFWTVCFLVGSGKDSLENTIRRYRIARIVPAGKEIVCCDELNTFLAWEEEERNWKPLYSARDQEQIRMVLLGLPELMFRFPQPMNGPVYDDRNHQIAAATISFKALGRKVFVSARNEGQWKLTEGAPPPGQPIALLARPGHPPVVVMTSGIQHVVRGLGTNAVMLRLPGISIPLSKAESLANVTPEESPFWAAPASAALDQQTGTLAVYSRGTIELLTPTGPGGRYESLLEERVIQDETEAAVVALGGQTCAVCRKDGTIKLLDSKTLKERRTLTGSRGTPPRAAVFSPDGRWLALLFHDGKLAMLDTKTDSLAPARVGGQGDISAIAYGPDGHLLVADRATRVIEYDLAADKRVRMLNAKLNLSERAYYYVIRPLYLFLPKPGEFYKTVQYLLTDQETEESSEGGELAGAQKKLRPWTPVWSSLAFMIGVLGLGCLYIQRQEF